MELFTICLQPRQTAREIEFGSPDNGYVYGLFGSLLFPYTYLLFNSFELRFLRGP